MNSIIWYINLACVYKPQLHKDDFISRIVEKKREKNFSLLIKLPSFLYSIHKNNALFNHRQNVLPLNGFCAYAFFVFLHLSHFLSRSLRFLSLDPLNISSTCCSTIFFGGDRCFLLVIYAVALNVFSSSSPLFYSVCESSTKS